MRNIVKIKSSTSSISNDELSASITTKSAIPTNGKYGAFGYAILTNARSDSLDNVVVIVTHLGIDDSSHENPRSGWHTHVLDLMNPSSPSCDGHTLEVDLDGSVANTAFDSDYAYGMKGNKLTITDVPISDLDNPSSVVGIAAFTVTPVFDSGNQLTNLCVDVVQ